jgi:hypothetical protein
MSRPLLFKCGALTGLDWLVWKLRGQQAAARRIALELGWVRAVKKADALLAPALVLLPMKPVTPGIIQLPDGRIMFSEDVALNTWRPLEGVQANAAGAYVQGMLLDAQQQDVLDALLRS